MPRNPKDTPALPRLILEMAHERRGGTEVMRGELDGYDLGIDAIRVTDEAKFLQQITELRQRAGYSEKATIRSWVRRHFRFVVYVKGSFEGSVMVLHAAANKCHRRWGVQLGNQGSKQERWWRVEWRARVV
jgi:hypothetical protein